MLPRRGPEVNGKPTETRHIGHEWHTDPSYTVRPLEATMLYCKEIPECGERISA